MRNHLRLVLLSMLIAVAPASAQVHVGIGLPSLTIGINLPSYPQLAPVPGYPVYYAPGLMWNYFFYDGMYWVYQDDNWYASSWYNGPWGLAAPEVVPAFVLRVPVSYYRRPPVYFRGWRSDAPPHWGEHWGHDWEQRRGGWDRWNHASVPARAPLPTYQLQYRGDQYPRAEQQRTLQNENYRYRPRDPVVREHYQAQVVQSAPVTGHAPEEKNPGPPGAHGANRPPPQQSPQPRSEVAEHQQQPPNSRGPEAGPPSKEAHETGRASGNGHEPERDQGEGRDHDRP
jgi:hypothetical protein